VQVLGQDNDGVDTKWMSLPHAPKGTPQPINMFQEEAVIPSLRQCDREKPRSSRHKGTSVIRQGSSLS
jgi:hypothetical protein